MNTITSYIIFALICVLALLFSYIRRNEEIKRKITIIFRVKIGFNSQYKSFKHRTIEATIKAKELEKLLIENKDKAIISLAGLTVEGDLNLRDIEFAGEVWFVDATFKGEVSFDKARFKDGVNFKMATFYGGVDFGEAVLRREKLYEIYKLENNKLMNTQIKIGFYGMRQVWNHQFAKATITGKELRKLFEENKDKRIVCLKGLTVEGDLDLRGIKFEGQLDFGDAVFKGEVWFGDFRFFTVDRDSFPLIVDSVQIYSNAYYDKLIFNCQDATFNGVVYFGKATLQGQPLYEIYKLENERLIKI